MAETPFIVPFRVTTHDLSLIMRTDARSTPPSVGGWFSSGGCLDLQSIAWFQYDIDNDLFKNLCGIDIDAETRISALELLAILVAVRTWGYMVKNAKVKLRLNIETDSMVCKNSIHRWNAKQEPMHTIMRELIITCVQHNISLFATHVAGDHNVWADSISRKHEKVWSKLNPERRSMLYNPNKVDFWLSRGKFPWFRPALVNPQPVERDLFFDLSWKDHKHE